MQPRKLIGNEICIAWRYEYLIFIFNIDCLLNILMYACMAHDILAPRLLYNTGMIDPKRIEACWR